MYREYTFKLAAVRFPTVSMAGVLRITGDIMVGKTVQVQARALKTGSFVPDKWTKLSSPHPVVVGESFNVDYALDHGGWKVSGSVRVAPPDFKTVQGKGSVSWGVLSSDVNLTGLLTAVGESTPPATPVADKKFTLKQLWQTGDETKGSGLGFSHDGRVVDIVYSNTMPRSDTFVRVAGKQIAHIGAETANVFTTPGHTWISTECGTTGEPAELVANELRGLGFKCHYSGCGANVGGKPLFFDMAKVDSNPIVSGNMRQTPPTAKDESGKIVCRFPGAGIPYDALVWPGGEYAVSLCDGKANGIAFSSGAFIPCDARALLYHNGWAFAGINGKLMIFSLEGKIIRTVSELLNKSIDSMCASEDGSIWISTSGTKDILYRYNPVSEVFSEVASFADDDDGGALFRTRVAAKGSRVLWGRNNKRAGNRWVLYDVVEAGTYIPVPPSTTPSETVDALSSAKWLGSNNATGYAIAHQLKVVCNSSGTTFLIDPGMSGDCFAGVAILRDGVLYAGGYDGFGGGSKPGTRGAKSLNNLTGNGKGGPYIAKSGPRLTEAASRAYLQLRKGEKFWQFVYCADTKRRSNLVECTWPI